MPRTYILTIFFNIFLILSYLTDLYKDHSYVYVISLLIVVVIFTRNGASTSVYTIEIKEKIDEQNQETAGSVYNFSILVGLGCGNLVALMIGQVFNLVKGD